MSKYICLILECIENKNYCNFICYYFVLCYKVQKEYVITIYFVRMKSIFLVTYLNLSINNLNVEICHKLSLYYKYISFWILFY